MYIELQMHRWKTFRRSTDLGHFHAFLQVLLLLLGLKDTYVCVCVLIRYPFLIEYEKVVLSKFSSTEKKKIIAINGDEGRHDDLFPFLARVCNSNHFSLKEIDHLRALRCVQLFRGEGNRGIEEISNFVVSRARARAMGNPVAFPRDNTTPGYE